MLQNYLITAWRNFAAGKLYSLLNITGLAVGMSVSFLLLLYVRHEYSFDKFHANAGRLYEVYKNQSNNGEIRTKPSTPQPLAPAIQQDFPEVENTARTSSPGISLISYGDKGLKAATIAADVSILQLFDFDFVYGSREHAFPDKSSILLTESVARAVFGNIDPVGKSIRYNNEFPMTVGGVIKDHPSNSSFSFKAMISWETFLYQQPWMKDAAWDAFNFNTYLLLKPGASIASVNKKLYGIIGRHNAEDAGIRMQAWPFQDQHLYNEFHNGYNTGGRIEYVRLFLALAIGILLIACINFMNLSTARSEKRAREIGVRKTMGAGRASLIKQFLAESLLIAVLSFFLSIVLLIILTPIFTAISGIPLSIPFASPGAWMTGIGITLVTGLLAGSYPALFLSSFNPVKVLKGQLTIAAAAVKPRQVLVVVQFSFAVALIVASIFIYRQIQYIRARPSGYDRNGLVEIPADGKLGTSFDNFRQDAISCGAITDAAMTSSTFTNNNASTWGVKWQEQKPGEEKIPIDCIGVSFHFIDTYGLKLAAGRDFDPARPADTMAVILNEAAVRLMRLKQPLGAEITWMGQKRKVVGVVQDFVWGSPYEPAKPAILAYTHDWIGSIGIRLPAQTPVAASLARLEEVYKKYNPLYPFEYSFTDDSFSTKYHDEKLLGSIALGFTILAIFISCLGLFGLASFSAGRRTKELGIRKILGATTAGLWLQLSAGFVWLIGLAFLIGSAIGWWSVDRWLSKYTYHTPFDIRVFVMTLAGSIMICLVAVSWQAINAALANPVDSLRSE